MKLYNGWPPIVFRLRPVRNRETAGNELRAGATVQNKRLCAPSPAQISK